MSYFEIWLNWAVGAKNPDHEGAHYEVVNGNASQYYLAGSTRLAMRQGGTLCYLRNDHLNSTSIVTSATGAKVSELRYKPWGEIRYTSGVTPTDYTYTGQRSEMESIGLMFYQARWYDPPWDASPARTPSFPAQAQVNLGIGSPTD